MYLDAQPLKKLNPCGQNISGYIKTLDKNHLVSLGSEGWFGRSTPEYQKYNPPTIEKYPVDWNETEGSDYVRNHNVSSVDICTFRLWNHWLPDGTSELDQKRFWENWMRSHFEASKFYLDKPVVLEEFGARHVPVSVRDEYFQLVYRSVESALKQGMPVAGSCFWMLSDDGR
eukprot:TRINITY_DN49921_c0_g1_i1.p1 TRINITY_DN49921_c0_g1~~TRINITY_DN49921_c0_g1_i1.p1  ORF type:complete len:172 (-),score=1.41 TRINITY_DN49921_c0_g1_i1:203-718(-)